jgi:putative transposase
MDASELALWRYSVIAPLLHQNNGASLRDLARTVAEDVLRGIDGDPASVSSDTVLRWYRAYRLHGLEGLEDELRRDRGRSRALDDAAQETLLALLEEHSGWTVKLLHREAERRLGRPLSIKAAYRLLKGRRSAPVPESHPRREPGLPQTLWIADTMHGPTVVDPKRRRRKTYLLAVLDDASRALMAARFATRDDISAFLPILREGVLARGLPSRLLVDNGPNYRSRVLRTACATLGIHLIHAMPYSPTSKARLERFFRTVRMRFLPTLPAVLTLEDLAPAWARYLAEYHAEPHTALTDLEGKPTSPLSYYLTHLPPDVRYVEAVTLEDLFQVEESRRVNPDGTIRVGDRLWDVDPKLAGSRVLVRFNPCFVTRVLYRPLGDSALPWGTAFPVQ